MVNRNRRSIPNHVDAINTERLAALNSFGTSVVEALAAGDGELPAGDGLSPDGDGLPVAAHTLSAVVEPALLSTSVVALQVVQFVQAF